MATDNRAISQHHWVDGEGRPNGGCTSGTGFVISWQNGPLGRGSERRAPNGAFVEHVIQAALGRLEHYQATSFASPFNAEAMEHLKAALAALERRTAERETRQVEGTHQV